MRRRTNGQGGRRKPRRGWGPQNPMKKVWKDGVTEQVQSFTKWGPMTLLGPALCIDVVKLLEICANGKEGQPRGSQAWWEPELLKTAFA